MAKSTKSSPETALYRPLADYLHAQGYTVRGEVRHCDIVATKGEELVAIELKNRFCTQLLIQATQRQRVADSVYIALPRTSVHRNRSYRRHVEHLLRRLEVGLILVSTDGHGRPVEVVFHPLPFNRKKSKGKRRALITEIEARSGDYNEGGSTRRGIVTAYREEAIYIACCLERLGALSPKSLRSIGSGVKTQSILQSNFYGWFERVARGVYGLTRQGNAALRKYAAVARKCRRRVGKSLPATPASQ